MFLLYRKYNKLNEMEGYEEVRGIFGEDDMREVIGGMMVLFVGCGTDHLPEIGPAGLPFLTQPPQSTKSRKRERQTTSDPKKE